MEAICSRLCKFLKPPQLMPVRNLYYKEKIAKGPLLRRFGYDELIYQGGLLPRSEDFRRIKEMPVYKPKNFWSEKKALFGQNDYIDILGNEKLHPTRILYHIPAWLRGYGGIEYRVILRKKQALQHTIYPTEYPSQWRDLNKRIRYLYKRLNRKTKTYFNEQ